jgi:hypothetical protein
VDDLNERSEQIRENVEAEIAQDDAQFVQLREQAGMAQALRTALGQVVDRERTLRDAEGDARARALTRANLFQRTGHPGAAREHRIIAAGHGAAYEQMDISITALREVLDLPDSQLVSAANDHLSWLRDSCARLSQRVDAATFALDGTPRTARALRVADGFARGQTNCYTAVDQALA